MRLLFLFVWVFLGPPVHAEESLRFGVVGMVESRTPFVIAGVEIVLPADTPVISPLGPNLPIEQGDTLAVTVVIENDQMIAKRVVEIYPAIGPITSVEDGSAIILGSAAHVPKDVSIRVGDVAALSGFWSGETIITTNTRRVGRSGFAHLAGVIEERSQQLGGSILTGAPPPTDGYGDHVWMLTGSASSEGLQVQLMSKGIFGGSVALTLWQGHASLPIASQTYLIHGTGVTGTATDAQMPSAGQLIERCAQAGRVISNAPVDLDQAYTLLGCARHIQVD